MPKKTSIYLPDDLVEAIRTSGKTIPDLIRLGLDAGDRDRKDRLAEAVEQMTAALRQGWQIVPRDE